MDAKIVSNEKGEDFWIFVTGSLLYRIDPSNGHPIFNVTMEIGTIGILKKSIF